MQIVSFKIDNSKDLELLLLLAERLGIQPLQKNGKKKKEEKKDGSNGKAMADALELIAQSNTLTGEISDPSQWQKAVRQDRNLPFHELLARQ